MLNTMEWNFFQPKKNILEHAVTGIELMDVGKF